MTAEICVFNKEGVALATDSASTLNEKNIYNSANKLFTLSKYKPIGIMVYNNSTLMGIPWETLIKIFREDIGNKNYDTVKDISEDFINFLKNFDYPKNIIENFIGDNVSNYFYKEILKRIHNIIDKFIEKGDIGPDNIDLKIKSIHETLIEEKYKEWDNYDYIDDLDDDFTSQFHKEYQDLINDVIDKIFSIELNKDTRKKLHNIAVYIFCKKYFTQMYTGLVIAGFGSKEIFPTIFTYKVESVLKGMIKYARENDYIIEETGAGIIPFAQKEMVYTFMEGIDPALQSYSDRFLRRIFKKYPCTVLKNAFKNVNFDNEELQNDLISIVQDQGEDLFDRYIKNMREFRAENYSDDILYIVRHLPKDELAIMAETLVNLTSFKRKVSKEAETVGGPIDVAVISKGDGFIWIKRKHYFNPEYNHHFFENYFKEV